MAHWPLRGGFLDQGAESPGQRAALAEGRRCKYAGTAACRLTLSPRPTPAPLGDPPVQPISRHPGPARAWASATRDAEQALGGVIQEGGQLPQHRVAASGREPRAPAPTRRDATFLLFNLTGADQLQAVEYEPWTGWGQTTYRLLDETGTELAVPGSATGASTLRMLHRIPSPDRCRHSATGCSASCAGTPAPAHVHPRLQVTPI